MPTIWKSTFQEPDTSGLMDRLLGEMESHENRLIDKIDEHRTPAHSYTGPRDDALAA